MKCNQICEWNSNVGCVKPCGVPCILENVSPTVRKDTNADRIRAMSDEELAGLFYDMCIGMEFCDSCPAVNNCPGESVGAWEEWLQQPAEE